MSPRPIRFLAALLVAVLSSAIAQTPPFDLNAYRSFLATHRDLGAEQLLALHPAGTFSRSAPTSFTSALYADLVASTYGLTAHEKSLIDQNGFMVTERIAQNSFGDAFLDIYRNDLPAFVSTDALLHAWHMSYDDILKDVESALLIRRLDTLLASLHSQMPLLETSYGGNSRMRQMLQDVDVYLTVPRKLLGTITDPYFPENTFLVAQVMQAIAAQYPTKIELFQSAARDIDFSQFTPRGHYTQSPQLTRYFQSMIWLGRIELQVLPSIEQSLFRPAEADYQRQAIDALLLHEAALGCDGYRKLEEIDRIVRFFVGESDNITLPQMRSLAGAAGLMNASALLDTLTFRNFCSVLRLQSYAYQRINSQILWSDPLNPEQSRPAGAFLLLGQRFVIDSYVTGNVVFDRVMYQGEKVLRMLPSTLDVLYALGNDAAAQLLTTGLDTYHYGSNLSAVRYLVESYEPEFWAGTLYNGWLRAIRTLNPPANRTSLPAFAQTAAWWQEKMNTQLASWAQLRHDNLLYAKQSYSGAVIICSFPETYVEPVPEFFEAFREMADSASAAFRSPLFGDFSNSSHASWFFDQMSAAADTLAAVAHKELTRTPLLDTEKEFLKHIIYQMSGGCGGSVYGGWYSRLFYSGQGALFANDRVVADVHTAPTDEDGNMVGWVLHAGTGPVNLAVVTTELPDGRTVACVGPVMSYCEHVTTGFKRLTDEEWKVSYAANSSLRPSLVNIYLADVAGSSRGAGPSLVTGISDDPASELLPTIVTLEQNFPNPFNGQTVITFGIPSSLRESFVDLVIYDLQGRRLRTLLHQKMPAGTFAARWNGDTESGAQAASGVYFYQLRVGAQLRTGKMALVR